MRRTVDAKPLTQIIVFKQFDGTPGKPADIVAVQEKLSVDVFASQVGRHERVLVTGPSKRDPNQLIGRTDGFKSVILPSGVGEVGGFVDVTIERATMATLFGRV